jgi:hypothetical protein
MAKINLGRLRKNYHLLQSLKRDSPHQRKFIIKKAHPDLIKTIADVCYNIVHVNLKLSTVKKKQLLRNKNKIRRLADKNVSLSTKRREIIQQGGFLSAIVPAISIAASLIGGLLSK